MFIKKPLPKFCYFFATFLLKKAPREANSSQVCLRPLAVLKSVWIKRKEGTKSRIRNLHNSDSLTLIPLISCNRDMGVRNEGADGTRMAFENTLRNLPGDALRIRSQSFRAAPTRAVRGVRRRAARGVRASSSATEFGRPLHRKVSRWFSQQKPLSADRDRMHRAEVDVDNVTEGVIRLEPISQFRATHDTSCPIQVCASVDFALDPRT